jgi:hypothetical protein
MLAARASPPLSARFLLPSAAATAAAAGEAIMRIPMRLAITDKDYSTGDEEDEQAQAGAADEQWAAPEEDERPWSVRLAGKLLGLVAQGGACPWQPYLRVLPERVPSPLTTFSWEDVQAIEVRSLCARCRLLCCACCR